MAGDSYSRAIAILKVALPLISLGILSTLFLLSSRIEPGQEIPFAQREIEERVRNQQVTGPFFAGVTTGGDEISFTAEQMTQGDDNNTTISKVSARLNFANGGSVALASDNGHVSLVEDNALLSGDILVESSTGYRMYTETLNSKLTELHIKAPQNVRAVGPAGRITAGSMEISTPEGSKSAQVLFSDGVKLVYDPKRPDQK